MGKLHRICQLEIHFLAQDVCQYYRGLYHNQSNFNYLSEERLGYIEGTKGAIVKEQRNRSTIHDFGYRMEFDYRPNVWNHIRFGSNYMHHLFVPQNYYSKYDDASPNALTDQIISRYRSNEFTFYAEDDLSVGKHVKLNGGVHYTLFGISGTKYHSIEPRAAIHLRLCDKASLKVSYTEMSQFMHQLSATYLNLPTDYWVPSTALITPMKSRQYAAGVYGKLPYGIRWNLEGFYKTLDNLIEYDGSSGVLNPTADRWENEVRTGKGKAYGMETDVSYSNGKTSVDASYTLSWSKRYFPDFYPAWYPDKFDNRHKLNIAFRHKFDDHIDAYAAWVYRSGDRATVPTQYVNGPSFPGTPDSSEPELIYEKPNNITLPAYHRLDLGANFRRITKRGFERIWNISVYNAYCRMNAFYTRIERLPDGGFRGKGFGIFPIIPSFCYTLKF